MIWNGFPKFFKIYAHIDQNCIIWKLPIFTDDLGVAVGRLHREYVINKMLSDKANLHGETCGEL